MDDDRLEFKKAKELGPHVYDDFCKCYDLAMKMSFHELTRGREGFMTGTVSERLNKLFEAFVEREENRAMGEGPCG
jgi:hypothetical protein